MTMAPRKSAKIAFFVPGWPLEKMPNGIVSYVANLRSGLASCGADSVVVAPGERETLEDDVLGVVARRTLVDRARSFVLRSAGMPEHEAADWLRALRATLADLRGRDLGIFEMEETFGWIRYLEMPGLQLVARLHGPWFLNGEAMGAVRDAKFDARVKEEGLAIARAGAVSAPSADVLQQVREYYRLDLPNARVIPNPGAAVPLDRTWNADTARPHQILFVGRFDRHKGGDLVLDAFPRIAALYPDAELVFAGFDSGFVDDAGRAWTLDEYVAERMPAEYRHRVHLLGRTKPERIASLRAESGVCVVASRYENFPMVGIEGLAFGCPLVAADAGGIPEIVSNERTGLLFRAGDASDLADKVSRMFAQPDVAKRCAQAARKEYEARFTPDAVADSMLDFYEVTAGRSLRTTRAAASGYPR